MGKKESSLWDDSALVNALDEALRKYKLMHTDASHDDTTEGEKSANNENELSVTEVCGNVEPDGKGNKMVGAAMEAREPCGYKETDQEVPPMQESQPEAGTCFPENNIELTGATSTHEKLDSYEGLEYTKLLKQYYEIEKQRQKILQQLQEVSYRYCPSSTEYQMPQAHQDFNTTNLGLQSPCCPCLGHCCPCAISSSCCSFYPWDAYKSISQSHQIYPGDQCVLASASGSMPIASKLETTGHSAHANSSSIETAKTTAESVVSSEFKASISPNVFEGEEQKGREETPVDGGQRSQAADSETDLAVVMNAWYSAGFYTGRYLLEQSIKKGLH